MHRHRHWGGRPAGLRRTFPTPKPPVCRARLHTLQDERRPRPRPWHPQQCSRSWTCATWRQARRFCAVTPADFASGLPQTARAVGPPLDGRKGRGGAVNRAAAQSKSPPSTNTRPHRAPSVLNRCGAHAARATVDVAKDLSRVPNDARPFRRARSPQKSGDRRGATSQAHRRTLRRRQRDRSWTT